MDNWQPIESAPKPEAGQFYFGHRLLLVVDCGPGSARGISIGFWLEDDFYLDPCRDKARNYGYRVTHWMPRPELPKQEE